MKFLVVGPGAMGSLFAARLKKVGYEVTLLDYIEERAEQINEQGIMVEGISGEYKVNVPTVASGIPTPPSLVLLCVKSYKTREASQAVKRRIGPETVIVTLQNGVGNLEILKEIFGRERVLGGVTSEGATLLGPGRIRLPAKEKPLLARAGIRTARPKSSSPPLTRLALRPGQQIM